MAIQHSPTGKVFRRAALAAFALALIGATLVTMAPETYATSGSGGGGGGGGGGYVCSSTPPQPSCPEGSSGGYYPSGYDSNGCVTGWTDDCVVPQVTTGHSQIFIAVTNSQSMDGNTSGAITRGSGAPVRYSFYSPSNSNYPAYTYYPEASPQIVGNSSIFSPMDYTPQNGFQPPVSPASSAAQYTIPTGPATPAGMAPNSAIALSSNYPGFTDTDNSPTRLNMVKAAIANILQNYASKIDFGIVGYGPQSTSENLTWSYYMSPSTGPFQFVGAPVTASSPGQSFTVNNPCYDYSTGDIDLVNACVPLEAYFKATQDVDINAMPFMLVGATSDDPNINDVFQFPFGSPDMYPPVVWMQAGGAFYKRGETTVNFTGTKTPYNTFSLSQYNRQITAASPPIYDQYTTLVPNTAPLATTPATTDWFYNSTETNYQLSYFPNSEIYASISSKAPSAYNYSKITPTNSGYLPYSNQVMYVERGMIYGGIPDPNWGNIYMAIQTAGANPTPASIQAVLNTAAPVIAPEYNDDTYDQTNMQAWATQSPIAAVLQQAGSNLSLETQYLTPCTKQYVILITDGLPTLDMSDKVWPPLGSAAATGYGVHAAYNADGSYNAAGSNDQAATDAINQVLALKAQNIETFVIGVGAGVDKSVNPAAAAYLNALAIAGGTQNYYSAGSQIQLNASVGAIIGSIATAQAAGAPVVPNTVSANSFVYAMSTDPTPVAGHVRAYALNSSDVPSATASWDAGLQMNATNRAGGLWSTATNGAATLLTSMDAAAFNLASPPADPCAPNPTVIAAYTIDPSYTYTASNGAACSYLGTRKPGWFLGGISNANNALLLGPPNNPYDLTLPGYLTFAGAESTRVQSILYTSADGFLYSSNAQTGAFNWGWMPRSSVAQLQNYQTVPTMGLMSGRFRAVDAYNGTTSAWSTYLVGNGLSGATLYDLQISSTGAPASQIATPTLPGGSTQPMPQAPVIANVSGSPLNPTGYTGTSQIGVEIANTGTAGTSSAASTIVEFNVATGQSSQAMIASNAIKGQITSQIFLDTASGEIYLGDSAGNVYVTSLSGNATTDAGNLSLIGTTQDGLPVHYIGVGVVNNEQSVWAATTSGITVFGIGPSGWQPLWATTPTSGYVYSGGSWATSTTIAALQSGSVISDAPALVNNILIVPDYVPVNQANVCGSAPGSGFYDFYNLKDGSFPANAIKDSSGQYVTGDESVGSGEPFTPGVSVSSTGVPVFGGGQGDLQPSPPFMFSKQGVNAVVQWRVH